MKIMFVCGAGIVSGKEKQTFATMKQLQAYGHEVTCIMSSWGSAEFERMLRQQKIEMTRMRIGFISKTLSFEAIRMTLHQLIYIPMLWWDYCRFVGKVQPDSIIHTNFHHLFLLYPVLGGPRQVFYVHDFFGPSHFFKMLFRLFKMRVDLFVGVSKFITGSLVNLGVHQDKIALIYNGVSVAEKPFHPAPTGLKIAIVGQVGEWKGHHVLIQAIAELLRQNKGAELHIIGDGIPDYIENLKGQVRSEGIEDKVTFRGRIDSLDEIYRNISIVCVPSLKEESFGLTAVEPGFYGIPVICAKMGALPEIVLDYKTGLVVESGNVQMLREALTFLVHHPEERLRMGSAASAYVNENFGINKTVRVFENALENLRKRKS